MENEIFADLVRSSGDLAGVFEYDGEAGYFYLYRTKGTDGAKIIDALHVVSGQIDFTRNDVSIQWDDSETKVALSIKKAVWAVFDCISGQKFAGNYGIGERPGIPQSIRF
ncbi:MAG TPA: DUF2251 domain-containing protein [Bradyrhizobium sp.]|nr:DUF2251 domain-containing protein [Bradyrhizobium sp.]